MIHRIKGLPGSVGTLITDYLLTTTFYELPLTNYTLYTLQIDTLITDYLITDYYFSLTTSNQLDF